MGKVGFWLKGSKGKLAGATMYKDANGDTVIREVVTPKNPQTTKQMIQRILMNTIMQAYSAMKEITDHSFENVTAGSKTMGIFMKRNLDFARAKVSQMQANGVDFYDMYNFVGLGEKEFVANQYLVSTGSLPQVVCEFNDTRLNELVVPAIKVNTYQGVADALGAQRGDQITFLMFTATSAVKRFRFCRVILDPTNEDGSQAAMSVPFTVATDNGVAINLPSVRNEGTEDMRFVINQTTGLGVKPTNESAFCGGVILSRLLNDNWLRSTCRLTYGEELSDYKSLGQCLDEAVSGKAVYAPNDLYLNNAGQGNSAGVEAGTDVPSGGGGSTTPDTPSGGGGGSETPSTGIQSVVYNGSTAIAGTKFNVQFDAIGSSKVIVRFNGAGDSVSVYDETDLENPVFSDDPTNSKVEITIKAPFEIDHTYKIYVGQTYANYSFRVFHQEDGD